MAQLYFNPNSVGNLQIIINQGDNMAIDPALLQSLQDLANQYKGELKGTFTLNPTTPPPSEDFDVLPQ